MDLHSILVIEIKPCSISIDNSTYVHYLEVMVLNKTNTSWKNVEQHFNYFQEYVGFF